MVLCEIVDVTAWFSCITYIMRYVAMMLRIQVSVLHSGCLAKGIGSLTEYLGYFETTSPIV